ncbi:MAG: hybrid sensor histidine kinase/response regulator [Calditrichaeota bacterium]|nr:MAG: hybrid sensor histidine kinase/response regulator [Calditrichota bacterium]MBL1204428.1 hybrid sensor histidine kinase/response regulator [Calditrichota bacterium]NOG44257.1 response regulator [Calditrichota bacterium]
METLRILIVEDDEDHAFLEADILNDELDCLVTVAISKADLENVDLSKQDIVLLDFNLPDATGSEILDLIREETDIPVIIITAQKEMQIAINTLKGGANDFLEKSPQNIAILPKTVKKVYKDYIENKKTQSKELEEEMLQIRVETLRQILTTLAHYINNSTTTISGYAQLATQNPEDIRRAVKLSQVSLKETQKITLVLKELESFVNNMEIKTTNYVDIPNAMFAIEENLKKKMKEVEEPESDQ